MNARDIIDDVRSRLKGEPVFLAGSLVAEDVHGLTNAHSDVDLFCPTPGALMTVGQKLLCQGYTLDDRFSRVWQRWVRYGFKQWHTNSLRMEDPFGNEVNLVYKLADGHPTTSLSQVLESFDFGLLGAGWELESDTFRDLRPYLFPQHTLPDGSISSGQALPMMPNKRSNWRNGFISQYNGLREMGRYAKYASYGYNMLYIKDDLSTGYWQASSYLVNHFDDEKQQLGRIYQTIAQHIDADNFDHMLKSSKEIDYKDALDEIMEALV